MTAASSLVEASTRIRGSVGSGTWRKTCANSAGPSLQAQPAPCDSAVRRMAFTSSADMGSTEDTLSESPSENGAGEDVAEDVANRTHDGRASLPGALRQARHRHDEAQQQEEEPPTAVSERIEPERGEEGHNGCFDRPPQQVPLREHPMPPDDFPDIVRASRIGVVEPQAQSADDREQIGRASCRERVWRSVEGG